MRLTLRRRTALTGYFFIMFWLVGLAIFFLVPLFRTRGNVLFGQTGNRFSQHFLFISKLV